MSSMTKFDSVFENEVVGATIPTQFIPACEKGFYECLEKGPLLGQPVGNVRLVLVEGAAHSVDSNENAFKTAMAGAMKQAFENSRPSLLEPIMKLTVTVPSEFQGDVMSSLNSRQGLITDSEEQNTEGTEDSSVSITAEVPLRCMFGYMTSLRSQTQGKGEFSMEYKHHAIMNEYVVEQILNAGKNNSKEGSKDNTKDKKLERAR